MVNYYKEHHVELSAAIMDINMPVMNGIEATTSIRDLEKSVETKRLPIIGLTGHASEDIKQTAMSAGMDTVITKPVKKNTLAHILDNHLSNAH